MGEATAAGGSSVVGRAVQEVRRCSTSTPTWSRSSSAASPLNFLGFASAPSSDLLRDQRRSSRAKGDGDGDNGDEDEEEDQLVACRHPWSSRPAEEAIRRGARQGRRGACSGHCRSVLASLCQCAPARDVAAFLDNIRRWGSCRTGRTTAPSSTRSCGRPKQRGL